MAKTNQLCTSKETKRNKQKKKMVGSKIYENDSYLRAVVGNCRESRAMQFKKFNFFFISPKEHQKDPVPDPFGKLFSKTVRIFKSSTEAPFLRKNRKV